MSDLIGKIVCGYRIVSEIGEGGMGKVYLAESAFLTEYKQQVAIKTLTARGATEKQAAIMKDLFIREANLQVQLKHPHIVSVIQFAAEVDQYFLILEFLPGYQHRGRRISNVADVINHEMGPIHPPLALKWFVQALDAMSYAHSFRYRWHGEDRVGIVHRDIKPANLLIADVSTVKVSDFGIVKVRQEGGTVTRDLTPGTSAYMAPEAILSPKQFGLSELDGRSDVYSLGVTLFEMLTGRVPFQPEEGVSRDSSLRRQHLEEKPPRPSSIRPQLNSDIDHLVLRALEKNPEDRYQSALEFKQAISDLESERRTVVINAVEPAVREGFETTPFAGTEVIPGRGTSLVGARGTSRDSRDPFLTSALVETPEPTFRKKPETTTTATRGYFWVIAAIATVLVLAIAAIPAADRLRLMWRNSNTPEVPSPTPLVKETASPAPITAPEGMIFIEGGSFRMGRDVTEAEKRLEVTIGIKQTNPFIYDYPAHDETVSSFFIDKWEVSNREYSEFIRATNRAQPENWPNLDPPPNAENLPVTFVNFQDAVDYCAFRGRRLPTEEEWEYAARGPNAGTPKSQLFLYPWGDEWENRRSNTLESRLGHTQLVTANPTGASPFGVLNMAGNVYEWTATDFTHYPGNDQRTPREKGYEGIYPIVRGGSFDYPKELAMTTTRVWARPTDKGKRLGFRCAANVK